MNEDFMPLTEPAKCLPTYLLLDTSGSMDRHEDLLNRMLEHVYDRLVTSPRVSEFVHLSLISFNTMPHLVMEMTDVEKVSALPLLTCSGATNYGSAFQLVRQRIDTDVPALTSAGRTVFRPVVFLFTDGEPTDGSWLAEFQQLVDPGWRRRPHVVTYGFGAAKADVLGKISTKAAFLADETEKEEDALAAMLTSFLHTMVASARTHALQIPTELEGFTSVPVEHVD